MTIFRLSPINTRSGDEKWSASTVQETVWVEARDDLHARHLVEAATLKMIDAKPSRPTLFSPWLDQVITSCFPDNDAKRPAKGQMLTASGKAIAIPGAEFD
ncbi:hypothetical protein ACVIIW_003936 [Bradyrhizobium sp. USDA 4449]